MNTETVIEGILYSGMIYHITVKQHLNQTIPYKWVNFGLTNDRYCRKCEGTDSANLPSETYSMQIKSDWNVERMRHVSSSERGTVAGNMQGFRGQRKASSAVWYIRSLLELSWKSTLTWWKVCQSSDELENTNEQPLNVIDVGMKTIDENLDSIDEIHLNSTSSVEWAVAPCKNFFLVCMFSNSVGKLP